jgi:hypothetical protein
MKNTPYFPLLVLLVALAPDAHGQAQAPSQPTPIQIASPPNDKTNYLSDRITFQFPQFVHRLNMTVEPKTQSPGCAPAGTSFKGIGNGLVNNVSQPLFLVTNVPSVDDENKTSVGISKCDNPDQRVKLGDVVQIDPQAITITPPDRFGLTYGALLVPFKYHLKGDKDFSGGASLGGYLGYRQSRSGTLGLAAQYVVFLGAANVAVPQTVNGQTTTQNMTGVSYGFAILGTVKDAFHLGLVLGWDKVNASANYQGNNKPWFAISVGYDFSQ